MPILRVALRSLGVVLAIYLGLTALLWFATGGAVAVGYWYFVKTLFAHGGNPWLARGFGVLFAFAIFLGLRHIFSLKTEDRRKGAYILVSALMAFNFVVFICDKNARADREIKSAADAADRSRRERAKAKALADKQKERAQKKQHQLEERQYREVYSTGLDTSNTDLERTVILAIKGEGPNAQVDSLRGYLTAFLESRDRLVLTTLFKPCFYADGLFDQVWNGDKAVLDKLRVSDGPHVFLFAKAAASAPKTSQIAAFQSVQGKLSLLLMTKRGAKGPWVYTAAGAGADADSAAALCAKRLAQALTADDFSLD